MILQFNFKQATPSFKEVSPERKLILPNVFSNFYQKHLLTTSSNSSTNYKKDFTKLVLVLVDQWNMKHEAPHAMFKL